MEGFGEKSFQNLVKSIQKARIVSPAKFLYSLGILNIGLSNAKLISKEYNHDFDKIRKATREELTTIPGIGDVIADSFVEFFQNEKNQVMVDDLLQVIQFEEQEENTVGQILAGKTFVITGSVEHFANRNEVKEAIELRGGKVTGSVTAKTDYLINNDNTSNSTKNKKAKELGIPIITEEEFINMIK